MIEYTKFYESTLTIAGILFPVFQAILFFIVEKSFSKLNYSKDLLIDFYKRYGLVITTTLIYLIIQPLILITNLGIQNIVFVCFLILLFAFRLELFRYSGYYHSLNSTKSNRYKDGTLLNYIRYLVNNPFNEKVIFGFFLILFVGLPINSFYFKNNFSFGGDFIFSSVFGSLIYALFSIALIINRPIYIQGHFNKNIIAGDDENNKWDNNKIANEKELISLQLSGNEYLPNIQSNSPNNVFNYWVSFFVKEDRELHMNITIDEFFDFDLAAIKAEIYFLSYKILEVLSKVNTEVGSFVLSYHFQIDGKTKNVFIRAYRSELVFTQKDPKVFIKGLKNTLIDEILK